MGMSPSFCLQNTMSKNDILCNLCNKPMTVIPDENKKGFTVVCQNECIPECHENVFGHGGTIKEAYEKSKEKYPKREITA